MRHEEIREARLAIGQTQKQFGEMLHAIERAVRAWEAGDRNMPKSTEALLEIKMEAKMQNEMSEVEYHTSLAMQDFHGEPWGIRRGNRTMMGHSGPNPIILAEAAERLLAAGKLCQSTPAAMYALEQEIWKEFNPFHEKTASDVEVVAAEAARRFALLPA
jgi:hypothetical protein